MMEGDLPSRAQKMVREWGEKYRADLLEMWRTQKFHQLPGWRNEMTKAYPRLTSTEPREDRFLFVTFEDGSCRVYDCGPLFESEPFSLLKDPSLFRSVS